ncbi:hypothetical protein G4Z16_14935 [Streptomyces bathyalis]|uniref:Uncharacterized protein n=1 Tax=Streptomyces bathyalis TaxID=2710756 RepID=A0A7T1WSS5_9ACTN|nr:hypothetical protein [Streptomyces bathyalis]QPP07467.1 hypothetical protein G4Z16_14935 [Streptomyces bathyalis]
MRAGSFLDDHVRLSASRGREHFVTMRRRIRPSGKVRAARELTARAREIAAMKGRPA